MARHVATWLAAPGAHASLAWQIAFAATCIASEPARWAGAAVRAVWHLLDAAGGAGGDGDGGAASRVLEWMWHLLAHALGSDDPAAPAVAQAASAGAALVAARRPDDAGVQESARLLRDAAGC